MVTSPMSLSPKTYPKYFLATGDLRNAEWSSVTLPDSPWLLDGIARLQMLQMRCCVMRWVARRATRMEQVISIWKAATDESKLTLAFSHRPNGNLKVLCRPTGPSPSENFFGHNWRLMDCR